MSLLKNLSFRLSPNSRRVPATAAKDPNQCLITKSVEENLQQLKSLLGDPQDLKLIFPADGTAFGVAYLTSLTSEKTIETKLAKLPPDLPGDNPAAGFLSGWEIENDLLPVRDRLLQGDLAVFFPDSSQCWLARCKATYVREPTVPEICKSYKGPKDGFVEEAGINLFLIRNRFRDHRLRVRKLVLGERSQSAVYVLYVEDLAEPAIVKTVTERLEAIRTDIITNVSDICQFIQDSWLSPFPQLEYVERPDVVTYALSQGRIAILHESSPGVILAPTTLFDLIDTPDDYHNTWTISASIIRFIRIIAILISTLLPAFYIALTAYNHEFIPTSLAFLIATSRENVPFPIPLEVFLGVSMVEISREAVSRLPQVIGLLTGFAGITVVIIAGVAFHLVSVPMIIVILFGTIAGSVITDNDLRISMRELQFFYMLMASFLGIYGVAMAFFYVAIHAFTLKSMGVPYLSPVAAFIPKYWGRLLFRFPAWALPRLHSYQAQETGKKEK